MTTISLSGASVLFGVVLIALIWGMVSRPGLMADPRGRLLGVFAFLLMPVLVTWGSFSTHMESTKTTSFCLSCHVMQDYGDSLRFDSADYLPAAHYQNRRIPIDHACYTCHTSYTMYGDLKSKVRGFRHLMAQVLGPPAKIELYEPYENRECLHCHWGARSFVENPMHSGALQLLKDNELSCLTCHSQVHHPPEGAKPALWTDPGESVE